MSRPQEFPFGVNCSTFRRASLPGSSDKSGCLIGLICATIIIGLRRRGMLTSHVMHTLLKPRHIFKVHFVRKAAFLF